MNDLQNKQKDMEHDKKMSKFFNLDFTQNEKREMEHDQKMSKFFNMAVDQN